MAAGADIAVAAPNIRMAVGEADVAKEKTHRSEKKTQDKTS